jgi:long-chain acyl-CoA synthetase
MSGDAVPDAEFAERLSAIWGSEVAAGTYADHQGLVYSSRPRSVNEMLVGVERWGERTFIVYADQRVSFAQFRSAIDGAGVMLREQGIGPGDRVMLRAYNCPEFVLAVWTLWAIGAVPVMANRWWSTAEIEHAIALTRPTLLITDNPGDADLPAAAGLPALPVSGLSGFLTGDTTPVELPAPAAVAEDDPALILFTSGSSGAPKAVLLSQRSVVANQQNLLARSRRLPQLLSADGEQQVTLVCTPLFHVGGVSNLITQLIVGGRLVLLDGKFDAGRVLEIIETERVGNWGGVPTMAIRVLEHPDLDKRDLTSLRSFPLGGAPLPATLLARMQDKLPQLQRRGLANTWGMTESGGFVTVAGNRDLAERPGTVGRPYPGSELAIHDPDADGVGEVILRAPTVMTGYLGGVDNDIIDGEGWLHTGDLGHIDADGYLFLDGRSKDIVIRGGENIACAHVEKALAAHDKVVEVAVFGIPHPDLGEELAAAVVHRPDVELSDDDLREYLRTKIAYFEIPTRWDIRTTSLPTLAGEKIDKRSLASALQEHS